jgi:serine/threonine protein kinase
LAACRYFGDFELPASDVYSLGAVLYHLLTGRPPFQADSLTMLLRQVIEAEPVAPRRLHASLPRDLETICLKGLEKEPGKRYATAQLLAEELSRFLERKPWVRLSTWKPANPSRNCRSIAAPGVSSARTDDGGSRVHRRNTASGVWVPGNPP